MKKRSKNYLTSVITGMILTTATAATLSGCSTVTPALSECAMTTNGGFGSNGQGITSIVHPGGKVSVGNGDTAWYYPCNDRNFVTAKSSGDRDNPSLSVPLLVTVPQVCPSTSGHQCTLPRTRMKPS